MKNIIALAVLTLALSASAQETNSIKFDKTLLTTNSVSVSTNKTYWERLTQNDKPWTWEFTLSGGGQTVNHQTEFGVDFSVATNPFKWPIWVGLAQGFAWEPTFAGSSDVFADWAIPVYKDVLFLNTGWSVGTTYNSAESAIWRTGPEVSLQWYVTDNTFIIGGINYDAFVGRGDTGVRYSLGIGLSW
jgi:hypothetical protein